jgi:hypothetical protein
VRTLLHILILSGAFMVSNASKAQTIDSIYVNLYTDSLKKGTYNYINIDGLLSNGRYLPLDSTQLIFSSSHGKFYGNSLWLEPDCKEKKIDIRVIMRSNSNMRKDFAMYLKTAADPQLKTEQQVLEEMRRSPQKKKKGK